MLAQERVVIENINPSLDNGDFFIKRVAGQAVEIKADIIADGHDAIEACVNFRHEKEKKSKSVRMVPAINDEFAAKIIVEKQGFYFYSIESWIDYALNWQHGIGKKISDSQHVKSELLEGIEYLQEIMAKAVASEKEYLKKLSLLFADEESYSIAIEEAVSEKLKAIFKKYPSKFLASRSKEFRVYVDRQKALFSTWYEFFPRSASGTGTHGTFKDCEKLLPRVAKMGFDTLYFPPVHPIGEINRKGKNNATHAAEGDVGSPWGIGSRHGGHKSLHPELGNLADFKSLVNTAKSLGIEVAMDFALQAAPDHPYVKDFPQWFKWRPDGTVQYAENPPKKYQDILPIYFESSDWKNLWKELLSCALFWIEECGIQVFRVDNPHTKPFHFWGWLIGEIKKKHPDVLFLSEAFTRPKVMHQLAKQGFTQSYTYFTWRNSKHELVEYITELTKTSQKEFFRPNFWPNTPDINPFPLQGANEATHLQKYFLAATLSSNTGIYGPVFEHMVSDAIPGKEEYQDSEKYQIRAWDWEKENKLMALIGKINSARRQQKSLQQTNNIEFCDTDNDQLLAYYKYDDARENEMLMVASLDAYYSRQGHVKVPLKALGISEGHNIIVTDLITGNSYHWDKEWCYVELHPALPFHLFKIQK
ncbi:MAG TPA: alpha-1,4-glucan--maltose-1-phosphate maltosyltransferase [Flavobacterium sp.]|nr:alpha-1,4-glucan--maltose-1-phosphate maltosyltransferase [Flavobacterium sp.]